MQELGEALARWLISEGLDVDASSRSLRDTWLSNETTRQRLRLASVQRSDTEDTTFDNTLSVPPEPARTTQIRERSASHRTVFPLIAAVVLCALVALFARHYVSGKNPVPVPVHAHAPIAPAPAAAPLPETPQAAPPPVATAPAPAARPSEAPAGAKKPKAARKPPKVDAEFGF
jgi:hypothetical protein